LRLTRTPSSFSKISLNDFFAAASSPEIQQQRRHTDATIHAVKTRSNGARMARLSAVALFKD
jgi:hypothetical protein